MSPLIPEKPTSLLGAVLRQSIPASVTMLSTTVTRFVDGLMVARVSEQAMAAQHIGAMTAFVPEALVMGMLSVVSTYVSQNLGAGRNRQCAAYAWAGLTIAAAAAVLIAPTALLIRHLFAALPTHNAEFVAMQTMYYRYMVLGVLLTLPSRALDQFFYGTHRSGVVMLTALGANLFNVAANYVLIYGKFGLAAMGLEGAAVGSLISWTLQLGVLLTLFFSARTHRRFQTRTRLRAEWGKMKDILRIGWPSGVEFCNRVLSWQVFLTVLVGSFGAAHLAATTLSVRYMALSFMPTVGVSIATTAMVGKQIGLGRKDQARRAARWGLAVAMTYMGLCGLAFWLFRGPMIEFFLGDYSASPVLRAQIVQIARQVLLLAALFQLFDAVGIVYTGALRGAGDTRWPMLVSITLRWCITVGMGAVVVHLAPGLGSLGPWLAASVCLCSMGLLLGWRFESGAWEKINLLGRGSEPALAAADAPILPDPLGPEDGETPH